MNYISRLRRWGRNLLCFSLVGLLGVMLLSPGAQAVETLSHAPATAQAYLIEPADGDTISGEFTAKFGLSGMDVAPAGTPQEGTGHHHLLIDLAELPPLTKPLPATDQIKHFGKGQTETRLNLAPGKHTLQLLLGDYTHVPHDHPVISKKVTVTVK